MIGQLSQLLRRRLAEAEIVLNQHEMAATITLVTSTGTVPNSGAPSIGSIASSMLSQHGHDVGSIRTIFAIPALTARAWPRVAIDHRVEMQRRMPVKCCWEGRACRADFLGKD